MPFGSPTVDVGNVGGDDGGDEIAAVTGVVLGDGGQARGRRGQDRGIVLTAVTVTVAVSVALLIGGGAAVGGRHRRRCRPSLPLVVSQAREGQVAGGARIVGGRARSEWRRCCPRARRTRIGDGAKGGPATAGVVLPGAHWCRRRR